MKTPKRFATFKASSIYLLCVSWNIYIKFMRKLQQQPNWIKVMPNESRRNGNNENITCKHIHGYSQIWWMRNSVNTKLIQRSCGIYIQCPQYTLHVHNTYTPSMEKKKCTNGEYNYSQCDLISRSNQKQQHSHSRTHNTKNKIHWCWCNGTFCRAQQETGDCDENKYVIK